MYAHVRQGLEAVSEVWRQSARSGGGGKDTQIPRISRIQTQKTREFPSLLLPTHHLPILFISTTSCLAVVRLSHQSLPPIEGSIPVGGRCPRGARPNQLHLSDLLGPSRSLPHRRTKLRYALSLEKRSLLMDGCPY